MKTPSLKFNKNTEYREVIFGNAFTFIPTNSFSRRELNYEEGEFLNIHYGDIHTHFNKIFDCKKENVPYVNNEISMSSNMYDRICCEGDLIFVDAAEDFEGIGKMIEIVNTNNQKILAGLHTLHARPDSKLFSKSYLAYLFETFFIKKQLMRLAVGASVKGLSSKSLSKTKLIVPDNNEQQKIVSFLTSVDDKINLLTEKKELLEKYKKGVIQKIFSQEIRFKDYNGNDFPNWEEKNLAEITKISIGEFVIKTKQKEDGLYPVYNGGKKPTGFYDSFNNEGEKIIISARGANAGFVNFEKGRYWAGNSCYSIEIINKKKNNTLFIYYYVKFRQHLFTHYQQAANIPSVSKKDVQVFKIICPEYEEQIKIAQFISSLEEKIDLVSSQIDKTKEFQKGLLQQMFV